MANEAFLQSAAPDALETVISILSARLDKRGSTAPPLREQHGRDSSYRPAYPPDAVALPSSRAAIDCAVAIMGSGIPVARIECLAEEHGSAGVCAMAAVKRAFDPRNILNPGKVVEAEETPPFI